MATVVGTVCFVLWWGVWAAYTVLDGLVIGAGLLRYRLAHQASAGGVPVSNAGVFTNRSQMWLLITGGAILMACPITKPFPFSSLYAGLLLLVAAVMLRAVAFKVYGRWAPFRPKPLADAVLLICTLLPALLLGVVFGAVLRGLPIGARGGHGGLWLPLDPYNALTALLFGALCAMQGTLYAASKATGSVQEQDQRMARGAWTLVLILSIMLVVYTWHDTRLRDNYVTHPVLLIIPLVAAIALVVTQLFADHGQLHRASAASRVATACWVASGVAGLFPNVVLSSVDPSFNVTIHHAAFSVLAEKTLVVMAIALVLHRLAERSDSAAMERG